MSKHIPELTDRQLRNFWLKIDKRGPDDCWEWLARGVKGYGQCHLRPAGMFLAHRVSYYLATGKQPASLCVCHKCDNPGCCNPAHLFLGTDADNVADCVRKGRHMTPSPVQRGEQNGNTALTNRDVLAIRRSGETNNALAERYKVVRNTISRIKTRKTWKHI